jgi:nicotinamide riboside transporter PnuC
VLNIIPLPIDDAIVSVGGALASYGMAAKRYEHISRWAMAPTLVAALYTVAGEFVVGPVDELVVGAVAAVASSLIASFSSRRAARRAAASAAVSPPAAVQSAAEDSATLPAKAPAAK